MSDPGKRDQRVAIHSDAGSTVDSVGQHVPSESLVGTYWAEVIGEGGREVYYAQQIHAETKFVVKMLADTVTRAIKPNVHRLVWRSRTLGILGVRQENYRDNELVFDCTEDM